MVRFVRVLGWKGLGLAGLVLLCSGCGQDGIDVAGEVTYDGEPLHTGSIVFMPADGVGPSRGATITDGKFSLTGDGAPAAGKKIVKISGAMKTGKQIPAAPPSPPGTMVDENIYVTPPTEEREITEGDANSLTFALTSAKKKK